MDSADLEALIAGIAVLGDPKDMTAPPGYDSLALGVLDSIYSMGVRYGGVKNVIGRYRDLRDEAGATASHDQPADLLAVIDGVGGPQAFADKVSNRQRTSTRNGILKAEAVRLEAAVLAEAGMVDPRHLTTASHEDIEALRQKWTSVRGQRSGISWHYFLMLARVPGVKPDRMIRRFVAKASGRRGANDVGVQEACDLVTAAAKRLGVDVRALDHAIWQYQRTR